MTDTKLLRKIIQDKGVKLKFIATELGITTNGLRLKIDNDNEFKASEIAKLLDILELNEDQLHKIFFA